MDVVYEPFIGKDVVLILKNGFRKFGRMTGHDDRFVAMLFYDGKPEAVNKDSISSIKLDQAK